MGVNIRSFMVGSIDAEIVVFTQIWDKLQFIFLRMVVMKMSMRILILTINIISFVVAAGIPVLSFLYYHRNARKKIIREETYNKRPELTGEGVAIPLMLIFSIIGIVSLPKYDIILEYFDAWFYPGLFLMALTLYYKAVNGPENPDEWRELKTRLISQYERSKGGMPELHFVNRDYWPEAMKLWSKISGIDEEELLLAYKDEKGRSLIEYERHDRTTREVIHKAYIIFFLFTVGVGIWTSLVFLREMIFFQMGIY